ncbi:response regulator [bacterium]|nr:response regulator [bacterium]
MSVWVVILLFLYLGRQTRKPYFLLWTAGWVFYSVYLAAAIGLQETPETPALLMARRACIGISALFMFWGSFQLTDARRTSPELALAVLLILTWSYIGAYHISERLWVTAAVFLLLASSGFYTGILYWRWRRRSYGAAVLSVGFMIWGVHLAAFPFWENSVALSTVGYVLSALLAFIITVGMVIEQQLTVSEQNYQALFDSAGDVMLLVDYDTFRVQTANAATCRITGRTPAELAGCSLDDLFPELRESGDAPAPAGGVARLTEAHRELHLERRGGEPRLVEVSANLVLCPQGPTLLIVARDVTERKRAEDTLRETARRLDSTLTELRQTQGQVIQQERLNALTKMASGIAHDFNNALAKILGFNELLLSAPENLADREKTKNYLQMINAAARDATLIVNRLREFYRHRDDREVYQAVDLNQVVEQAVVLSQPKWKDQVMARGATVWVETDLRDVAPVRGLAGDLREVLMNLIFNAVEAMPDGGRLTLATRTAGDQVELTVSDTGTGLSPEARQRCFEPFYTTKPDRGTGLGLAIVYGIVQRHGGTVTVDSESGHGTTFRLLLPIQSDPELAAALAAGPQQVPRLRVLLVEDEPAIRDIETAYLVSDGHTVEAAADGREGLDKFQSNRYDLVVADLAMPRLNGDRMVEAIKEAAPATPVIMVTGYSEALQQGPGRPGIPDLILPKPITRGALRDGIARVWASSRGGS